MKKNTIIIVIAALALFFLWGVSRYNKLVSAIKAVSSQWEMLKININDVPI
jgi:hypothetical protein